MINRSKPHPRTPGSDPRDTRRKHEDHPTRLSTEIHIFQCMGNVFCVEFQMKFRTKYLSHTAIHAIFLQRWNFKSS